jgi:hypothetical protein
MLAFFTAAMLAAGSATATPIVFNDTPTIQALATQEFQPAWAAGTLADVEMQRPLSALAAQVWHANTRADELGVADTRLPVGLVLFASKVTRDMLLVHCDDFDVLQHSLGAGDAEDLFAGPVDPLRLLTNPVAAAGGASSRATAEAAPAPAATPDAPRDVAKASLSRVQPATLTIAGLCLAGALAGWREWTRRHRQRRSHRRYSLHRH